jgi:hypothetical protein
VPKKANETVHRSRTVITLPSEAAQRDDVSYRRAVGCPQVTCFIAAFVVALLRKLRLKRSVCLFPHTHTHTHTHARTHCLRLNWSPNERIACLRNDMELLRRWRSEARGYLFFAREIQELTELALPVQVTLTQNTRPTILHGVLHKILLFM